jgi:hypothetical protein
MEQNQLPLEQVALAVALALVAMAAVLLLALQPLSAEGEAVGKMVGQ